VPDNYIPAADKIQTPENLYLQQLPVTQFVYHDTLNLCWSTLYIIEFWYSLMILVSVISTLIGVLHLYSFVLVESLQLAIRCRNMLQFDTCHKLYLCDLLFIAFC